MIKKQTLEDNLVELISLPEFQKESCKVKKNMSIISLIICSVLYDFPVNEITNKDFIDGKHMKEIYLTISKLIEKFGYNLAKCMGFARLFRVSPNSFPSLI